MADNKARDAALKESAARVEAETAEAAARQNTQPTPTQAENDRAKLGVDSLAELDDKESDGSPEENSDRAALNYSTRDAGPKRK